MGMQVVWLIAFCALALLTIPAARVVTPVSAGNVCPLNSIFVFSRKDQRSMCACEPGFECIGDECTQGSDRERFSSFKASATGFPMTCARCACKNSANPDEAPVFNNEGKTQIQGGTVYYLHPDEHFDAKCRVDKSVIAPAPKALSKFSWVHIPKAGTSLTTLMYNYLCKDFSTQQTYKGLLLPDLQKLKSFKKYTSGTCLWCWKPCHTRPCPLFDLWSPHDGLIPDQAHHKHRVSYEKFCTGEILGNVPGHRPVPREDMLGARKGALLGLFRDPRRRAISAFNYHRHSYGMEQKIKRGLIRTKTLEEFLAFPGIASCQTKHLTGTKCGVIPSNITIHTAVAAARRLSDFSFYGITDFYATSICLFHRMYGGKMHKNEIDNLRDTKDYEDQYKEKGFTTLEKKAWMTLSVTRDPLDWLVYVVALHGFYDKVVRYGLEVSASLREHTAVVRSHCKDWILYVQGKSTLDAATLATEDQSHVLTDEDVASLFRDPSTLPDFPQQPDISIPGFREQDDSNDDDDNDNDNDRGGNPSQQFSVPNFFHSLTEKQARSLPKYAQRSYAAMFADASPMLRLVAQRCLSYRDPPAYTQGTR